MGKKPSGAAMNLKKLSQEQLKKIIERHKARDVSYFSPSWDRHAMVRWRLYNAETGKDYGPRKA
jgi:hypothetical protein